MKDPKKELEHGNAATEAYKAKDDLAAEAHVIAAKHFRQDRSLIVTKCQEEAVKDLDFQNVTDDTLRTAYKTGHDMGVTRALVAAGLGVE